MEPAAVDNLTKAIEAHLASDAANAALVQPAIDAATASIEAETARGFGRTDFKRTTRLAESFSDCYTFAGG